MTAKLHQSQIDTFFRCPMQYYFRYVEDRIVPPGVALVAGTATHKTSLEIDLAHKRATGELLDLATIQDAARDAVNEAWDTRGVALDDEERARGEATVKGETVDKAVALSTYHHNELAPLRDPVHIERPWLLNVKGTNLQLQGTIDLQEPTTLRDLKTASKSPAQDRAQKSLQLTMYHMAATILDKTPPQTLYLDTLVDLKRGPQAVIQETTRTKAHWTQLLHRIEVMLDAINKGVFLPTTPDNWVCSAKYCGYWKDTCPFGRRGRERKSR